MHMSFALSAQVHESEIMLSTAADNQTTAVVAIASPHFERGFRFECAFYPGHYLAFKPPTHMRIVNRIEDPGVVIDFVLVDYSSKFMYMTIEEVLVPSVKALGGDVDFVPLWRVR